LFLLRSVVDPLLLPYISSGDAGTAEGPMDKVDSDRILENRLTERQREVLVCMAKGMANSEIAKQLYISRRSVEREIASARQAFNVESREVLLLIAYHLRVINDDHLSAHIEKLCDSGSRS
jgi:NarL family two-component system response regulator LiaR